MSKFQRHPLWDGRFFVKPFFLALLPNLLVSLSLSHIFLDEYVLLVSVIYCLLFKQTFADDKSESQEIINRISRKGKANHSFNLIPCHLHSSLSDSQASSNDDFYSYSLPTCTNLFLLWVSLLPTFPFSFYYSFYMLLYYNGGFVQC